MIDYLLDTNHVSAVLASDPRVTDPIHSHPAGTFAVCLPSVGELWFMVYKSRRTAINRRRLTTLLQDLEVLAFDHSAAIEFGRIKADLARRGTVIPDVDVQIAAIARSRGLVLLTADAHFSHISEVTTEDWTAS